MSSDDPHQLQPLQELASCVICEGLLENPRLLSCGHAYCCACLKRWCAARVQRGLADLLTCPNCRKVQPNITCVEQIDFLPVAFFFNILVDYITEQQRVKAVHVNVNAESAPSQAVPPPSFDGVSGVGDEAASPISPPDGSTRAADTVSDVTQNVTAREPVVVMRNSQQHLLAVSASQTENDDNACERISWLIEDIENAAYPSEAQPDVIPSIPPQNNVLDFVNTWEEFARENMIDKLHNLMDRQQCQFGQISALNSAAAAAASAPTPPPDLFDAPANSNVVGSPSNFSVSNECDSPEEMMDYEWLQEQMEKHCEFKIETSVAINHFLSDKHSKRAVRLIECIERCGVNATATSDQRSPPFSQTSPSSSSFISSSSNLTGVGSSSHHHHHHNVSKSNLYSHFSFITLEHANNDVHLIRFDPQKIEASFRIHHDNTVMQPVCVKQIQHSIYVTVQCAQMSTYAVGSLTHATICFVARYDLEGNQVCCSQVFEQTGQSQNTTVSPAIYDMEWAPAHVFGRGSDNFDHLFVSMPSSNKIARFQLDTLANRSDMDFIFPVGHQPTNLAYYAGHSTLLDSNRLLTETASGCKLVATCPSSGSVIIAEIVSGDYKIVSLSENYGIIPVSIVQTAQPDARLLIMTQQDERTYSTAMEAANQHQQSDASHPPIRRFFWMEIFRHRILLKQIKYSATFNNKPIHCFNTIRPSTDNRGGDQEATCLMPGRLLVTTSKRCYVMKPAKTLQNDLAGSLQKQCSLL